MPTTYEVQSTTMHQGLVSPADSNVSALVVQAEPILRVTRTVVFYPVDASAGGGGESSVVF